MNIKKAVIGLLAAMALTWAPAAYAADNGTEFGIADDLTVLGVEGTAADPDAEIKGFTVFGATQSAYTGAVVGAGNVVVNGYLAVSSGAYFVGGSTFAAGGAYFTGVSSFSSPGNIHVGGGVGGQVLTKVSGAGMEWSNIADMVTGDNLGSHIATTTLQMANHEIMGAGHITASSVTLSGQVIVAGTSTLTGEVGMGGALGVAGAATFNGAITLGNEAADAVTVNGNADLNGTINADGDAAFNANVALGNGLTDLVTVNGQSSFVAGSTFSAGAYFTGVSSFSSPGNIHVGGGVGGQVLTKVSGAGMEWSNIADMVTGDNLGSHIATTTLQMANHEIMGAGHITASSATLTETLNVAGAVDLDTTLNVDGSVRFGSGPSVAHAINMAAEDGVALSVDSDGTQAAGKYAAKFYSGGSLAAWIKKK